MPTGDSSVMRRNKLPTDTTVRMNAKQLRRVKKAYPQKSLVFKSISCTASSTGQKQEMEAGSAAARRGGCGQEGPQQSALR